MTESYLLKKSIEELLDFRRAMTKLGYVELAREAEQELNFRGYYFVPRLNTFEKVEVIKHDR